MSEKELYWLGTSKEDVLAFPPTARRSAGYNLGLVQLGDDLRNFTAMPQIGSGAMEIRVDAGGDAYRVLYVAKMEEAIYVLHAFQKKSSKGKATPKPDLEKAKRRYKEMLAERPARE